MAVIAAAALAHTIWPRGSGSASSGPDRASPTSVTVIERRPLSQQTQVSATLGYAHPSTIVAPQGSPTAGLQQARQALAAAQSALRGTQRALTVDSATLAQARAALASERAKQSVDCVGASAAQTPSTSGGTAGGDFTSPPCAADGQVAATDVQAVTVAATPVTADRSELASARSAASAAGSTLTADQTSELAYGDGSTYTSLPAPGEIVKRGRPLYAVGGRPVILLYGVTAAWRAFARGMAPGSDVAALNANLAALGYLHGAGGRTFTPATARAIAAFQTARGLAPTRRLLLGSVVFEPGAVRVTGVVPALGASVQAGPVLSITSTRRQVSIALDTALQAQVKLGDPVAITLPDHATIPGRISYVGTVATIGSGDQASGGSGGSASPTIAVEVAPRDPAATGRLDRAPVDVSITTASVERALVVPVNALLALAGGRYAVEEVAAGGVHRLLAVELGLFDDQDGLVQVSGRGIAAGQRVVVPAT